jgi:hypothetical protein
MAHKIKEDGVVWHAYGSLRAIGDATNVMLSYLTSSLIL